MSLRTQLRSLKRSMYGRRWTIREVDNVLTEVKMYTDKQLLKILEKNYEGFINNSRQ